MSKPTRVELAVALCRRAGVPPSGPNGAFTSADVDGALAILPVQASASREDPVDALCRLRGVRPSGPDGAFTPSDVDAAIAISCVLASAAARPVYAAAGPPPAQSNPLAAQTLANAPDAYASAARVAPVPELFHAGPRPAFTASGVDPSVLDQIAWPARHPAARASSAATAYELLQAYPAGDPDAVSYALAEYQDDPGNVDYQHRMQAWIVGGSSPDQIYASLYAHDPRDLGA
jgi:hypothetical protein